MSHSFVSFSMRGSVVEVSRVVRRMLEWAWFDDLAFVVKAEAEVESNLGRGIKDIAMVELNRVSALLIAEWERVERCRVNPSRITTFVDMARVAIADRDSVRSPPALPPRKEWIAERDMQGECETSDYVDGWNDALDACVQGACVQGVPVTQGHDAHAFEARSDGSLVIYATMPNQDGLPVRINRNRVLALLVACGKALACVTETR
jgi:hypothetical protein